MGRPCGSSCWIKVQHPRAWGTLWPSWRRDPGHSWGAPHHVLGSSLPPPREPSPSGTSSEPPPLPQGASVGRGTSPSYNRPPSNSGRWLRSPCGCVSEGQVPSLKNRKVTPSLQPHVTTKFSPLLPEKPVLRLRDSVNQSDPRPQRTPRTGEMRSRPGKQRLRGVEDGGHAQPVLGCPELPPGHKGWHQMLPGEDDAGPRTARTWMDTGCQMPSRKRALKHTFTSSTTPLGTISVFFQ